MAFKKIRKLSLDLSTPQTLFRDMKNKKIPGLLEHQSTIIDNYMDNYYNSKNVALELPTGSGKTLVGLLLGEFKRLKDKKRVVYVCPTVQLVNQVVEQSKKKYGIKTIAFTGKIKEYNAENKSAFIAGDSIAVTTYSAIFNSNTFFDNVDVFIFDDAHSSDSYISKFWTIDISRETNYDVYVNFTNALKSYIEKDSYHRMLSKSCDEIDINWVDVISVFDLDGIIENITSIIDEWEKDFKNREAWKNIKGYLEACNIYISYSQIIIKPMISPTQTFQPFSKAEQRIYMSATLGESGELQRITGIDNIDTIGVPEGWDKQGLGRRFFMFPTAKFNDAEMYDFIIDTIKMEERSVILAPDDTTCEKIKNLLEERTDYKIMGNSDFSKSKEKFVNETKAIAVLANRFDGMDFEGDECRLLFLWGLPKAMNLQERFFITRLATSILFNERIRTRLTQAIGRCTRGIVDYSAVCILGSNIEKELVMEEKKALFHPELAAEIDFGYEQSRNLESYDDAIENMQIFKEHGDEWDSADGEILSLRKNIIEQREKSPNKMKKIFESLSEASKYEVKFQYSLWNKNYKKCIIDVNNILNNLNNEALKGYRGYWNYMAAYVYKRDFQLVNALQCKEKALKFIGGLTWLPNILDSRSLEDRNSNDYDKRQVENIEQYIVKLQPGNVKYERKCSEIINGLKDRGTKVEEALKELGTLIGYSADNKNIPTAPDTYWILNNGVCLISECKIKDKDTNPIDAEEIREAKTHREWLISNGIITNDTITYTVFVTNSKYLHVDACSIASELYYVNIVDVQNFANKALGVISDIKGILKTDGDIILRERALEKLKLNNFMTTSKIINAISNTPIKEIDVKK